MTGIESIGALVVDDHEPMRAFMARTLRQAGAADVREAEDATQALALLAVRPADLILVDQSMPGMDGLGFIRAARADPRNAHARILMLTGHEERSLADAARAAGADAVLVKPASPSVVLAAVAALF